MKSNDYMKTIIMLLVLPFALCGVALGQEITGNLAGNVKDSSGAIDRRCHGRSEELGSAHGRNQ
jgi:hypothetical protein